MTATNTTNKSLSEPASGDLNWDVNLNANFTTIDKAFGSFFNIATTTGNYPSTGPQIASWPTDLQNMCLKSNTSAFTANVTYTIPNGIAGQWVVVNQSASSAFTLSVVCGASSVLVDNGKTRSIYCDGTSVFYADSPASAGSNTQVIYNSAGTLTGSANLTFNGAVVSVGGSTATTNASCASTTATVTFSNGQTIPVGSVVTIIGVTPTGYNGSWVTTGTATLNQVQFTVPVALSNQTVAGTLSYGNLNLGGNLIGGIASQALAAAGTNNSAVMTPLSTAQAITAQATGGMTLLGTLTTTSGTTQSLTSLTLTGYKQLVLEFNGVSHSSASNSELALGAGQIARALTSANVVTGMVWVSLVTGIATSVLSVALPADATSGRNAQTGYSTATTTVTLTVSNPSFDAGSVLVYGVR